MLCSLISYITHVALPSSFAKPETSPETAIQQISLVLRTITSPNCLRNKDFKFKHFIYYIIEFNEI